jgi:hypothetical protein
VCSCIVDAIERYVKNAHDRIAIAMALTDALNMKWYPFARLALKADDLPRFPVAYGWNVWPHVNGFALWAVELSAQLF